MVGRGGVNATPPVKGVLYTELRAMPLALRHSERTADPAKTSA